MERCGEFAAANLQAESYLEREHNARWAALGVAHATSGITASVSLNSVLSIDVDRTYTRIECLTHGQRSNRLHNTAICPRHSESKRRQSARGDHKRQAPLDVGARKRWLVAEGVQEIEQGPTYLDGELYDLR
jgi:hypothetical protein